MRKLWINTENDDEGPVFHCAFYEDGHCIDSFEVDAIEMNLEKGDMNDE